MNNKVKVFISSRCKEIKYCVVRSSLKLLLEKTGMVDVYVFESSGGSSRDVETGYLNAIEDSDLCIFLIDNDDGVSEAVMKEYTRAKELNKKSLYFFCCETCKTSTKIQEEIGLSAKWEPVTLFSEFPEKVYHTVLNDIIDIYRGYCKGFLSKFNSAGISVNEDNTTIVTLSQVQTRRIDFSFFSKLRAEFGNLYYDYKSLMTIINEQENSSKLDTLCTDLFLNIICKKSMPMNTLNLILKESISISGNSYSTFLTKRKEALEAYFSGDIELCFKNLKSAYNEANSNPSIPNWLLMDVLIDCRNIFINIGEMNNQLNIDSEWQRKISENHEPLYYPVLDRYVESHNEKINKFLMQQKTDSPYTSRVENIEYLFDYNAKSFVVAALNFSLTQLLCTIDRQEDSLTAFCCVYSDHTAFINLSQILLIRQNEKELKKIIYAFGYCQKIGYTNENDVKRLWDAVKMIPIEHKRNTSFLLLFRYFGYYFSNDSYELLSDKIKKFVIAWKLDDKKIYLYENYIIESLKSNAYRIDNNWFVDIISDMFLSNNFHWIRNSYEFLISLEAKRLSNNSIKKLISAFEFLVSSDSAMKNNSNEIEHCLMLMRIKFSDYKNQIDRIVKEKFPVYFATEYDLEINSSNNDNLIHHVERYLNTIKNQGENGIYKGYANNQFAIISNVIRNYKPQLNKDLICSLFESILYTLSIKTQNIDTQVSSIDLFITLFNTYDKELFHDKIESFSQIANSDIFGHQIDFIATSTSQTLYFYKIIMKILIGSISYKDLITALASYYNNTDYEIISSLKAINSLFEGYNQDNFEEKLSAALLQYVFSMSLKENQDCRYYSVCILVKLINTQYKEIILEQLSRMMDTESPELKILIVRSVKKVSDEQAYKELILQKAQADNHYLVRRLASELL